MIDGQPLMALAPQSHSPTDYDRSQLALYAAILDWLDGGRGWADGARTLMGLNPSDAGACDCWQSHAKRAEWLTSGGLQGAILVFGSRTNL